MSSKQYLFELMPVKQAVLKQIIPSICSKMIILVYNLADTYFVGLLNNPVATAAVTVCYSSSIMLTAISNLFAIGGSSFMARALGERNEEKARDISSVSFWFGLALAILFSFSYWVLAKPILTLCGATETTYLASYNYAKWVVIAGGTGTVMNILLSDLVRAEGSAVLAACGVSFGGILNIILDPLFVLPQFLNMGAEGAGLATAISNLCAALLLFLAVIVRKNKTVISFNPSRLRRTACYIKEIVSVGIPSCIQYVLTVVSVAALSKFVSAYSTEAVAALGITKKLDQIPLYFSLGTANGILPLLAYNYSSGNQKRRHECFVFGCSVAVGFSLLCVVCFELFAGTLAGLFIDNSVTVAYASSFLRIMVLAMPFMSVAYPMICQFQAMGKAKESLVCSILRKGVLDIPLLFILDTLFPLYGCMAVQPIVDCTSLVVALIFYRRINTSESIK